MESFAVGDKEFVVETKARLGEMAVGWKISGRNGNYELRESPIPYRPLFTLYSSSPMVPQVFKKNMNPN